MPMREFSRSLPMTLMRAREAVMAEFRPTLHSFDLTEQQWRVLRALAEQQGAITVGELADRTLLLGPSLSRILVNLDDRGLIERTTDGGDQRRSHIVISSVGSELFQQIAPINEERYRWVEQRFGAARLAQLYDLLNDLTQLRDVPPGDEP
jgi:homoprotocatechuate degradation regulator HpaR